MHRKLRYTIVSSAAVALFAATLALAQAAQYFNFDLPEQPMADALRALGGQTRINILVDPPLVAGVRAPALKARLTGAQGLSRLLESSGIRYEFLNDNTVVLGTEVKATGPASLPGAPQRPATTPSTPAPK